MKYDELSIEEIKQEHERWKRKYKRWKIFINTFSILVMIGLVVFVIMFILSENC